MYEVNKEAAFDSLMEEINELVTICGGWDDKADDYKPGVKEQLDTIRQAAQQAIGLPID